jgi:two-component system nitrate/nitrite response regulator NarL
MTMKTLTPQEQAVIDLMCEGLSNKLIGDRLSISPHTVKFHIVNIMRKYESDNRTQAAVKYTREKLAA